MTEPVATTTTAPQGDPARAALGRLRAEVGKAVVGQDAVVTGLVIALLCRGPRAAGGRARGGEDAAGPHPRRRARPGHQAGAVHPRPDARRRHRLADLRRRAPPRSQFREGPVFTNLLLADEINRTPPKTQSALLEVMEERQVSVEGARPAAAGPVHGRRHPEPDRVRGHLPAARGAAGPVPAQADRAAAQPGRGARRAARPPPGFDPRDLARGRRTAGGRRGRPGRRPRRRSQPGAGGRRRCSATSWTCAGPPGPPRRWSWAPRPGARPRCSARRRRGPGWPAADYVTPGRRQGGRPADAAAPGPAAARGGAGGRHRRRGAGRACWPPCRPRDDPGGRPLAARGAGRAHPGGLAGRRSARAVAGDRPAPVLLLDRRWTAALAAPAARASRLEPRRGPPVRFGWAPRTVALRRHQHRSGRTLRARVRDAWVPSAGARRDVPPDGCRARPGRRSGAAQPAHPDPARRPAGGAGDRPLATGRWGWRTGRPPRRPRRQHPAVDAARAARRSPPGGILPEKLSRLRVIDGAGGDPGARARAPSSTPCASTWSATTSARSTGGPAPAARTCVVRTWRPERDRRRVVRAGHRPDLGRRGSATSPGWTPRSTPRCCSTALAARAGDRVDLLAVDTEVRATVTSGGQQALLSRLVERDGRRCSRRWSETDFGLVVARGAARGTGGAAWWCCSPRWSRARSARGCCRCCPGWPPGTGWCVAAVHDPALDRARPPARRHAAGRSTPPRPAERALAERDRVRAALAGTG